MADQVKSFGVYKLTCGVRGNGWLKCRAILCARGRSAEMEWLGRKPFRVGDIGSKFSSGCRTRSRTLKAGWRRDMGR